MFGQWRQQPVEVIEKIGKTSLEPVRAAYYNGKPGKPLRLVMKARQDFLSIWRKGDYADRVSSMNILGRQIVVVNSPDEIKYVTATRAANFERKSPQMRRALEYLLGDGLFISDGETWRERRPLVGDIVHKSRVPSFGPVIEQSAEELVGRWERLTEDRTINVLTEMAGLTAVIIARAVFGNDLAERDARAVTDGFTRYQALIDSVNIGYFLGFDNGLPLLRTPGLRKSVASIHGIIDRVVDDHLAGRGDHNSMIELLVKRQRKTPGSKLDTVALRNEAATIFMAGHETTAATLTWAWYLLSRAPWVEKEIHKEIDARCAERTPTVADVSELPWCAAVIKETLRLYPPVPILARQAREADRIGGIDVAPASLVLIVPWLLHRTEAFFAKAHMFKPERFFDERKHLPYSYIPFAVGPRVCPGLQFGLTEAILCLAIIAQRFRVRVGEETRVEPQCRLTLRPRDGLPATLQRRT